jgi:hypothetical protein
LGYDYRNPKHVERYGKLVVRNPDGSTEGRDPCDVPLEDLGDFLAAIRAIRAKCVDCSGGSSAEARKCTAIGCALWPYRMETNPRRAGLGNPAGLRENLPLNSGFSEPDASDEELPVPAPERAEEPAE